MDSLTLFFALTTVIATFIQSKQIYPATSEANDDWWKHATFYQIYPRSFKDSDGDGVGDLPGITSKLSHLVDAGITAAWLSPIFTSPGVDAGYDISDYRSIDESFGTMEDFEELIEAATNLGLKIILDFVPNHTSDQHEWFELSKNGSEGYQDYYIWLNGSEGGHSPPNNWVSVFKYSAWKYEESRQQWYYHQFAEAQPDLNYRNPKVVQEMKDILVYWLEKGVSGFRVDAVPFLFEDSSFQDEPLSDDHENFSLNDTRYLKHIYTMDQPETFDMIYQWREVVDNYTNIHGGDTRVLMTEAYTSINNTMYYYGNEATDGAHFTFNFLFIVKVHADSTANDIAAVIEEWFEHMDTRFVPNWVIGNHDNHRVATRFGQENVDGFNMLVALLPGVAVTYNGEEIGMEDGEVTWEEGNDPSACNGNEEDFNSTSRDFERTPFHWDNTTNAGFSNASETWLPVSSKYLENNLLFQSAYEIKSHFHIYQDLMKLRRENTLMYGNLNIEILDAYVLAFTRELDGNDAYVLVFNIGDSASNISLSIFSSLGDNIEVVTSSIESTREHGDIICTGSVTLNAHEAIVAKTTNETSSYECSSADEIEGTDVPNDSLEMEESTLLSSTLANEEPTTSDTIIESEEHAEVGIASGPNNYLQLNMCNLIVVISFYTIVLI